MWILCVLIIFLTKDCKKIVKKQDLTKDFKIQSGSVHLAEAWQEFAAALN